MVTKSYDTLDMILSWHRTLISHGLPRYLACFKHSEFDIIAHQGPGIKFLTSHTISWQSMATSETSKRPHTNKTLRTSCENACIRHATRYACNVTVKYETSHDISVTSDETHTSQRIKWILPSLFTAFCIHPCLVYSPHKKNVVSKNPALKSRWECLKIMCFALKPGVQ